MNKTRKLFIASLICGVLSLPIITTFSTTETKSVVAEGEITKQEVFEIIRGKTYYCPDTVYTFTISDTEYETAKFALFGSSGEIGNLSVSAAVFNADTLTFIGGLGARFYDFDSDFLTVNVKNSGTDYGTFGLIIKHDREEYPDQPGHKEYYECAGKFYEQENLTSKIGEQSELNDWLSLNGNGYLEPTDKGLSTGAVVGISVGAVAGVSLVSYVTMLGIFIKTKKAPKFLIKSFEWILKTFKK